MNIRKSLAPIAVAVVGYFAFAAAAHEASAHAGSAANAAILANITDQREIRIDIFPRRKDNEIDLSRGNARVDVAVLGDPAYPFGDMDWATMEFGGGLPLSLRGSSSDVNNDRINDMTFQFVVSKLKLTEADTIACVTVTSINAQKFKGCDMVKVIKKGY